MAYQFVVVCVCVYSFTHHTQYYSSNDRTPLPVCMPFCSSHFLLCLFLQLWVHCYLFIIISTLLGAGYWFLSQSLISGVFTSVFFFSSDSVLTLWTTLFLVSHAHTLVLSWPDPTSDHVSEEIMTALQSAQLNSAAASRNKALHLDPYDSQVNNRCIAVLIDQSLMDVLSFRYWSYSWSQTGSDHTHQEVLKKEIVSDSNTDPAIDITQHSVAST